jgi:hypothetical protein
MPQYLPLPDGSTVTIREGESPQQAYARAQQMYPEAFKSLQAPAAPKETTFGGQTKEFFKGLVPGAIGLVEQAGTGISALLPEEQEKATQQYIKETAAAAKAPFAAAPGYEDTVLRKFGEATGSFLPFVATGPFGLAGRVAGYGLGIGAGAGTQVEKSAAEGATEGQQTASTLLGAAVGATEMFAPTRILKRLGEPVLEGAMSYVKRALMAGGEEAAQEAASQAAQNIISKGIYKPEQEIIEQVGESAAYGGAVGALAQGLLDLAIGRRAPTTPLTDEVKQAREEAAAQAEQEKIRLNSPEYAQEVFQKTQELEAQRTALKQQLIPIRKGESPETDYAHNRDINRQIEAINKELKPLAEEYVRVKPILKQAAEQERLDKMSPEDFMLEQLGLKVEPINRPAPKQIINEFGQIVDEEAQTPAPDPVKDYAVGQVQSAQNVGQLGLDDYADYLMQDPKMAAQVLQQRPELPGLNKNDQGLVFSGVRFRLQAQEKQAQAAANAIFKQEMGTRKTAFSATKPEKEAPEIQAFTSYMDDLKSQRNDVGDDMFFKYMVDPKLEKISEGKPPVIAVNPQLMPFANIKLAERSREKINSLFDEIDQADTDRDVALRSNNQDAATAAFERGNQALEQLNAFTEPTPAGELTKGRFPSAKVSPQASVYAKEVLRVRNEQNTALNTIEDKIDRLRRGDALGREGVEPGKGVAAASPVVLAKQAEEARGKYISAVLEEAAIHRRVAGKPELTYDEAIKAASRIHDVVGDWIDRSKAQPEKTPQFDLKPIREKVQKSGNTARTYKVYDEETKSPVELTIVRQPDGTVFRVFSRYLDGKGGGSEFDNSYAKSIPDEQIVQKSFLATEIFSLGEESAAFTGDINKFAKLSDKEVKHFKAQIAKVVDGLSEMPSQVSRETPILKQQFAATEAQKVAEARGETAKTAGGELRRLREYVGNMIDKALTRNPPEEIQNSLERVKEIIEDGKASKELLDAAQNQAARILRGEDLGKQVYTKREAVPGKRVVENVPGREAETRFGERGRTYKSVGYETELAPEGSSLRELQDAIKLYERTAQEGEIAGEGAAGQGQLFPKTRKDIGYIRATPANFAKSPQIKPVWEALDQARKLKAKTEANQKARSVRDKQGFAQIEAIEAQLEAIKNQMQFFLLKPGDFNIGKYSNADIAKMFASYPEAGVTKEDKLLMDRYLQVSRQSIGKTAEQKEQAMSVFTEEEKQKVNRLIQDFNASKIPEYEKNVKQALQALSLGQRLESTNNRLVELMQDNNAAVRKQSEAARKTVEPLLDKLKLIKDSLRNSVLLTDGQRAMLDSEIALQSQRGAYKDAMAKAMGKARQRLSDTLGELLDPEIERARRALKAAKTRLATVESQIEAAKKEMTEGTGQAPNLINNLQKVQGLVENIEKAETELADLQEARFGEIENDVVVTEAMLDKDLKTEREYLELLERQLADMRKESLTAVELGGRGELGKLKYPFSAQRLETQVKTQQAAVDEAQKRANEFQKDVEVWWPKVTAAFKKDGISVKDLPGAVFKKGRKVADINTPEQKRLDTLRDKGMQAAKEVDEAAVLQRVKDKQLEIFDDEIFDARGEVQSFMGPENMEQLADIMADPKTTNVKRIQATLKLGAMQKLASLEAQKEVFLIGKPAKAPKAATVPSTTALAAAKPFRTGSGVAKAFTPAEMDEMARADIRDANELAKKILGTKAPQLKEPSKRKQGKMIDPNMGLFDDFEFSRGTPVKGLTKAELEAELTAGMGEPVTGRKIEAMVSNKLAVYESVQDFLDKQPKLKGVGKSKYEGLIPADAKGFVQDGKAVLFANNIGKGHGLGVLLHEVGVHLGFRNFFNEGQYNALVKTVKNWANKTEDSLEARVGKAAVRRVEAANTPPHQIDDELLAYAVEEAMQMGVEPVGVKGGNAVKNWLKMVVDGFKKALEKFGITSKNLTAGDLVNFAYGAAHLELKGTWHGTGVSFDMFDHTYMNTGSKAQAYGWGTYRAQKYGTADSYRIEAVTKTGGLYDQWVDRPDIQAWLQTQRPEFTGKLPAGIPEQFLNMPLREANNAYSGQNPNKIFKEAVQGEIENIEEERKQFSNLSSAPRAAQTTPARTATPITAAQVRAAAAPARVTARPITATPVRNYGYGPVTKPLSWRVEWMQGLSDAEVDKKIEELKKFAETADEHLKAVNQFPVYKGKEYIELYKAYPTAAKVIHAFDKMMDANQGTPPSWKEAIASVKAEASKNVKDFGEFFERFAYGKDPYTKQVYDEAKETLRDIDAFDIKDFTYNPPSGPPVPEPAGYMMRTLHTRPENEYILYDSPADKQPEVVKDAFKRIYDGLDKKQQAVFNRSIGHVRQRQNGRDLYNALSAVLEQGGMPSELCDMFTSEMLHAEGVAGIKFFDGVSRFSATGLGVPGTYNYVDFGDKDEGAQIIATDINPINQTQPMQKSEILFSRAAEFTNPEIAKRGDFINKIVAKERSLWQRIKANLTGLAFETQLVDRFAGFERLAKYMEPLKGTQMLYYLRMYDQRMNFVSQAVSNGAPAIVEKTRPDGRVERVMESKESANIHNVVQILKDAQPMVGNAEAVNTMFTLYMAAIRADNKGLASLNFGEDVTQELLNDTMSAIKATPGLEAVFKDAQAEYNEYNRNLIEFVVSTGALSKEVGKRLLRENDYIPFYRERNGVAELLIGGESPIRIGSIAEQPYLHELVGGDRPILDFMTSSVQNTNLLMDMGMRNLATKNAVFELVDLKAAKFVKISAGPDVVKFRDDGEDRYAVIATEKVKIGNKEFDTGVPADILVKGMEGIPTQMPAMLRVMAMPAQLLRKAITLSPLYTAKQLFRDSLAAPILSGADFMPVIGALKEINSATKKTLESRGITGGQQFVGGAADLTKILRDVSEGKPGWMTALGKLEAMSMAADAATRRAQYNSYIEQGLSEMEATLLALESMNFNKRGASPSIHIANSMIPFFNAQIQGMNVLYKASMGKMPFNDQLRIREKMMQRGAFMAVASLAYAAIMQDDEAYKNANPDQKYGNWFIRVPGLDEPIKLPVPFEVGYIFKALPEAIYNSMVNEHGGEEAVKAFKQILLQTIPGGSSYGIPQIMKPAIEAGLGKSFYTGRDILSAREKELLPEEQFRAITSELAKGIGRTLGISPIVFEQLVSGYTGTMGLAFMHALSVGVPTDESPDKAVKRLSQYPILGGAFQPNDAGGISNSVYERMNENLKVKNTFNKLAQEGRMSEAMALLQRRGNEFMQANLANSFKANMNKLTQAERAIAASNMSPEAKGEQLDKIRKIKTAVAQTVRDVSDKTIRLATPF